MVDPSQFSEPLTTTIAHYVLSAVGGYLAIVISLATKRLREQEGTRVKSNLSFRYVVKQEPEYQEMYDAVMKRNGK
ncbi:MAG TPA: hypothetical protein VGK24_09570 [Candidatus Angelobacter sp.]|jgi:hypothetical protein